MDGCLYDRHVFHFIVDNGITFLCMTDEDVKRRVTFGFLEDIKRIWRSKYASIEGAAMAFSLQETFSPILKQQIVRISVYCTICRIIAETHMYRICTLQIPLGIIFQESKLKSTPL